MKVLGAQTPFSVEGLADAAIQLKQTGTAMSEMNEILRMIGDTAGGSTDKFNPFSCKLCTDPISRKNNSDGLETICNDGIADLRCIEGYGRTGCCNWRADYRSFSKE